MTEIYDLRIIRMATATGTYEEIIATGTFEEVTDELCRMRMHGCYFQDIGDAITITRRE